MRRNLQVFLTVVGLVMVIAGVAGVVLGVRTVPRPGEVIATVDSEMRFFSVWYAAAGVVLLRCVGRVESEGGYVRMVAAAFFLAGCARVLSIVLVGIPHPTQLVLMGIEFLLPLVILPWHAAVVRASRGSFEKNGTLSQPS